MNATPGAKLDAVIVPSIAGKDPDASVPVAVPSRAEFLFIMFAAIVDDGNEAIAQVPPPS
jgi:hypothetical protein